MNLTKEIYTTRDAANLIGVLPPQICYEITTGKLKAEKVGTGYIIKRENLIEYLNFRKARTNGKK